MRNYPIPRLTPPNLEVLWWGRGAYHSLSWIAWWGKILKCLKSLDPMICRFSHPWGFENDGQDQLFPKSQIKQESY